MRADPESSWKAVLLIYAIDGALLGLFMIAVGVFSSALYAPDSPLHDFIPGALARNAVMGLGMGLTAFALITSPWGGRSGAHMNPAVTLAFLRLGRIRARHAAGYIAAQFLLGWLATVFIGYVVGPWFTGDPVRFAATMPGAWGAPAAFIAEFAMTFAMMMTILTVTNTKRFARYTVGFAGLLLFLYITFEAPVSGMSINPARTLASAIPSGEHRAIWLYFTAPIAGGLLAAEVFARGSCFPAAHCCKLNHQRREHCIHCRGDGPIDFDAHKNNPS